MDVICGLRIVVPHKGEGQWQERGRFRNSQLGVVATTRFGCGCIPASRRLSTAGPSPGDEDNTRNVVQSTRASGFRTPAVFLPTSLTFLIRKSFFKIFSYIFTHFLVAVFSGSGISVNGFVPSQTSKKEGGKRMSPESSHRPVSQPALILCPGLRCQSWSGGSIFYLTFFFNLLL